MRAGSTNPETCPFFGVDLEFADRLECTEESHETPDVHDWPTQDPDAPRHGRPRGTAVLSEGGAIEIRQGRSWSGRKNSRQRGRRMSAASMACKLSGPKCAISTTSAYEATPAVRHRRPQKLHEWRSQSITSHPEPAVMIAEPSLRRERCGRPRSFHGTPCSGLPEIVERAESRARREALHRKIRFSSVYDVSSRKPACPSCNLSVQVDVDVMSTAKAQVTRSPAPCLHICDASRTKNDSGACASVNWPYSKIG